VIKSMPRKKPRKKKKSKKNHDKRKSKIKPAVCVLIDTDGSTVRFERWGGELFFYIDGDLAQRYVRILQVQRKKGWIIIRGLKLKNDQIFSQEVKTVVEIRPEDKERVLEEIDRIRYWHGPFCTNTLAFLDDDFLRLSKYDARKGSWQCITHSTQKTIEAKEPEMQLCFSILPSNCKIRQDTDFYRFIETEKMGNGLIANKDIQQKKIVMKDRPILFVNWFRGHALDYPLLGDLFHSLLTEHPKVWEYILNNLSKAGDYEFSSSAQKLCESREERDPMYKDEKIVQQFTDMLSIFFSNTFEFSFTNHDHLSCLFPNLSIFNHSCDPNCQVEFAQNQTGFYGSVRALRPIKAGEPLTISYFGNQNLDPVTEKRRDSIRQERHFTCFCSRCVTECIDATEI